MRQKRKQRATKYDRVVLATHWLADETGSLCTASHGEIATEAGCQVEVAVKHLRAMEAKGVICRMPPDRNLGNRRPIWILDGPLLQAGPEDDFTNCSTVCVQPMDSAVAPEDCVEIGFDECADSRLTDAEFRLVLLLRAYGEPGFTFADMVRDCSWVYRASKVQRLRTSLRNLENFGYIRRMSADSDRFVACVLGFSKQGA